LADRRSRTFPAEHAQSVPESRPNGEWREPRQRLDDRWQGRRRRPPTEERTMPHLLDPKHLSSQASYLAAIDELDTLLAEEPDVSAGHRVDELFALIEDYELRRAPAQPHPG
jgi:hypothetical protein